MATTSSEGSDRPNLQLPSDQTNLCSTVGKTNPKTVAVVITPGAILTPPWDADVSSIITSFMPGQEEGNAVAAILYGDANPSGKLPVTFPNVDNEVVFTQQQYPGVNLHATYSEDLLIGYRWYNAKNVNARWPFGHGLSYTTFSYSNIQVNGRTVTVDVTNSGGVSGAEVVQLYVGFPASSGEPPQQLKGFSKLGLNVGEKKTATFTLSDRDLSIWDATAHKWALQSGTFQIRVGSSSGDIRAFSTLTI